MARGAKHLRRTARCESSPPGIRRAVTSRPGFAHKENSESGLRGRDAAADLPRISDLAASYFSSRGRTTRSAPYNPKLPDGAVPAGGGPSAVAVNAVGAQSE